nr:hypothetical protein [Candidatus Sigynarchaeota archaeon]
MDEQDELKRLAEDSQAYHLLDRIAFHVEKGEKVRYVDFTVEYINKIAILLLILTAPLTVLVIDLVNMNGEWHVAMFGGIQVDIGVIAACFVGAFLIWRHANAFCIVNAIVFTDKAIYSSTANDRKKITQSDTERVPYDSIKAFSYHAKKYPFQRQKLTVKIYERYDIRYSDAFTFRNEFYQAKRIIESLLYFYNSPETCKARHLEKMGVEASQRAGTHAVSASRLNKIRMTLMRYLLISPPIDLGVLYLGTWIIHAIAYSSSASQPEYFFWFIESFFLFVLLAVVAGQVYTVKQLSEFHAPANSVIMPLDDGIEHERRGSRDVIKFSMRSQFVPGFAIKEPDHILVSTLGDRKRPIKLGPVDDMFYLYYDLMAKYDAWLEKTEYFVSPEVIAASCIADQPYISRIAKRLQAENVEEVTAPATTIGALTRLKEIITAMDDFVPRMATLDEIKQNLHYSLEKYLDHIDAGEKICFIHQPSHQRGNVNEIILTTKGVIISTKGMMGHLTKVLYTDIRSASPGELAADRISFKNVALNLQKNNHVEDSIKVHIRDVNGNVIPNVEQASRVDMGSIPMDSPIFVILKKIGKVFIDL